MAFSVGALEVMDMEDMENMGTRIGSISCSDPSFSLVVRKLTVYLRAPKFSFS